MASRYFGYNAGESKSGITEAAATTGKTVEVAVDLAPGVSQHEVLKGLELITDRIKQGIWPPA